MLINATRKALAEGKSVISFTFGYDVVFEYLTQEHPLNVECLRRGTDTSFYMEVWPGCSQMLHLCYAPDRASWLGSLKPTLWPGRSCAALAKEVVDLAGSYRKAETIVGITASHLNRIANDKVEPSINSLKAIVRCLKFRQRYLQN